LLDGPLPPARPPPALPRTETRCLEGPDERRTLSKKVVGLTGGIATGKSTVSEMLRERGIPVIDADLIARNVVTPGRAAWRRIVRAFGTDVLSPEGEIERDKLGKLVFSDPQARKKLNQATHPFIYWEILTRLAWHAFRRTPLVVIDAALLLETKTRLMVGPVIVVYADPETQLERLMKRDGYARQEALRRVRSQMPLQEKCTRADHVIDNSGDLADTEAQVQKILQDIQNSGRRRCAPRRPQP
jgi:dephospho-CoA kinase